MILNVIKVLMPVALSFFIGLAITPTLTTYLYKHRMWKKRSVVRSIDGREAPLSAALHNDESKKTPRMGGIVVWGSAAITMLGLWILALWFPNSAAPKLDFVSRNQTWIPFMTLLIGAFVGLIDDYLVTRDDPAKGAYVGGGLSASKRLLTVVVLALFCGYWFYSKLDVVTIGGGGIFGPFYIGWLLIPLFAIVALAVYSGGVIDGLDGLSGGVFASIFAAYGLIAFHQQQIDLAAFCGAILGGILAFLWFNIPPARYYLSETGAMALTITLSVVAFMTDSLGEGNGLFVLPIIALPLVITSASVIIQLLSKKFRNGKKVFRIAPLHNHFGALGWPAPKIVMRYWIIGVIAAILGVIISLISRV